MFFGTVKPADGIYQVKFSVLIDKTEVHNVVNTLPRPFYHVKVMAGQGYIPLQVKYRCLAWQTLPGPEQCPRRVVSGSGHNIDSLLTEGSEFMEEEEFTSWYGQNVQTTIDLGCVKTINGFYARNFHSGQTWQDGTEQLEVSICNSTVFTECQDSQTFTIPKITGASMEKTIFFPLNEEVTARFVRIKIKSYYGVRGGLHYFRENESPNVGSSYQGKSMTDELRK